MHSQGGRLSVHLDYSIHPKLKLQRKLNLIVYLEEDYNPDWGGSLQLWSHDYDNKKPLEKVKEIQPLFNNAIIFDTTQKSWHGFPEPINPPVGTPLSLNKYAYNFGFGGDNFVLFFDNFLNIFIDSFSLFSSGL